MAIYIVTDSASDITQEEAKTLGITVVPLKTIFGDQEYLDGVTLTHEEFYKKLKTEKELPTTSQVSPYQYEEAFKDHTDDSIICITVSGGLSGCLQSAKIASEGYNVAVVDSENVSIGESILVKKALRLIDEGMSFEEIVDTLNKVKKDIRVIALFDTLENLKRGGRLSASAATIGSLLSIKPVVTIQDGLIEVLGKARGAKKGGNLLTEFVEKQGAINFDEPLAMVYSGSDRKLLDDYVNAHEDLFIDHMKKEDLPVSNIGSVIGTHAGEGAVGIAFFAKNK
jgi:DegV family protein with EDD domain